MTAIVLLLTKEDPEHFLMLTCISKSNGKDMLNCFINIYVHTELVDWLYCVIPQQCVNARLRDI